MNDSGKIFASYLVVLCPPSITAFALYGALLVILSTKKGDLLSRFMVADEWFGFNSGTVASSFEERFE